MWSSFKAFIGLSELEEKEEFTSGLQETPVRIEKNNNLQNLTLDLIHNRKKNNRSDLLEITVRIVNSFDEAQALADYIKNKLPIIVNLKRLDQSTKQRLLSFLFGVAYALDAKTQKLETKLILFAPAGMNIITDSEERDIFANKDVYSPVSITNFETEEDSTEDSFNYETRKYQFSS